VFIPTTAFTETSVSATLGRKTLTGGVTEVLVAHRGSGSQRYITV